MTLEAYPDMAEATADVRLRMTKTGTRWPDLTLAAMLEITNLVSRALIIMRAMEALYAARFHIDDNTLEVAIRLWKTAQESDLNGVTSTGRGDAAILAMRREISRVNGLAGPRPEGGEWPDASTDPEPWPEYTIYDDEAEL